MIWHMLREGAGLDSWATADCPTAYLSQTIYSGATKEWLGKGFFSEFCDVTIKMVSYVFSLD